MTPFSEADANRQAAERFASATATVRRLNPHLYPPTAPVTPETAKPGRRLRQSRDSLNKTEARAVAFLRATRPGATIRTQCLRLRIASSWYKADAVMWGGGLNRLTFVEVKGPKMFDSGVRAFKDAAVAWQDLGDFVLIWEATPGRGDWREQWMEKTVQ